MILQLIPLSDALLFTAVDIGERVSAGLQNIEVNNGVSMTLTGMGVVFSGLVVLSLILTLLPESLNFVKRCTSRKNGEVHCEQVPESSAPKKQLTGEETAAICTALILYHRMHMGDQREILTARSELKMLSPWALSGKIHPVKKRR